MLAATRSWTSPPSSHPRKCGRLAGTDFYVYDEEPAISQERLAMKKFAPHAGAPHEQRRRTASRQPARWRVYSRVRKDPSRSGKMNQRQDPGTGEQAVRRPIGDSLDEPFVDKQSFLCFEIPAQAIDYHEI